MLLGRAIFVNKSLSIFDPKKLWFENRFENATGAPESQCIFQSAPDAFIRRDQRAPGRFTKMKAFPHGELYEHAAVAYP